MPSLPDDSDDAAVDAFVAAVQADSGIQRVNILLEAHIGDVNTSDAALLAEVAEAGVADDDAKHQQNQRSRAPRGKKAKKKILMQLYSQAYMH